MLQVRKEIGHCAQCSILIVNVDRAKSELNNDQINMDKVDIRC